MTPDAIDQAVESGETVRAALGRAAPVFIVYRTAFVDGSGKVQFRNDLYNWDAKLKEILSG